MFATFDEIKNAVKRIVKSHTYINDEYVGPRSGIYMLYVDNFSDSTVIPIYVGKTVNFRQRLKQHIRDIDLINQTSFADYQTAFLRGAFGMKCPYDGKFKACKIFKYMVDHACVWDDLRMIVLEYCEKEQLEEKEQAWIEKLRPAYVGFNQIDSLTLQWVLKDRPQEYRDLVIHEAELFRYYLDYGYSAFNYLHSFTNCRYNPYKKELDRRAFQHITGELAAEDPKALMDKFFWLYEDYKKEYDIARPIIEQRYASLIHSCFKKCKLNSKAREREVIDLIVNSDPYNAITEVFATKEYLRYYMSRNRASRICGEQLDKFIKSKTIEIRLLTIHVEEKYKLWVDHRIISLASSRYGLIFPSKSFKIMPLGELQ